MPNSPSRRGPVLPVWNPKKQQIRKWILANRGACADAAELHGVSKEYVRLVLYGERGAGKGGREKKASTEMMAEIRRTLKMRGAPIA